MSNKCTNISCFDRHDSIAKGFERGGDVPLQVWTLRLGNVAINPALRNFFSVNALCN